MLAASLGMEWLGPPASNNKAKTQWRCCNGHEFASTYKSVARYQGGCPICAGNQPKKPEDYLALAEARGYIWLGPTVSATRYKTGWRCQVGHEWEASYTSLRGCPVCTGNAPKQAHDFERLAATHDIEWLGPQVVTTKDKTLWRCRNGHEFSSSYNQVHRGALCPTCAGNVPKTPSDYMALAAAHSLTWLGPEVINSKTKTNWRCEQGHDFSAPYHDVAASPHGCPKCGKTIGGRKRWPDEGEFIDTARLRGYKWLGPHTARTSDTHWRCEHGHEWRMSLYRVSRGQGCPACSGNLPRTAGDYADLAQLSGYIWLGPLPAKTSEPTMWQCPKGHTFESSHIGLRNRLSCPMCQGRANGFFISSCQVAIHKKLGGELNRRVWRYAIDVAIERNGIKIAVEYDAWYWHQGRKADDARRDAFLAQRGWRILRIKSARLIPTKRALNAAIARLVAGSEYEEIVLPDWRG